MVNTMIPLTGIKTKLASIVEGVKRRNPLRKEQFSAFTLSTNFKFIEWCICNSIDAYSEMKERWKKVTRALYTYSAKRHYIYMIEYRTIWGDSGNKNPHIHGIIYCDCIAVLKHLQKLWSRHQLGNQSYKSKGKRGNCDFQPIYDLQGWFKYIHCFRNKYGSNMSRRCSKLGNEFLKKCSPFDIEHWSKCKSLKELSNYIYQSAMASIQ